MRGGTAARPQSAGRSDAPQRSEIRARRLARSRRDSARRARCGNRVTAPVSPSTRRDAPARGEQRRRRSRRRRRHVPNTGAPFKHRTGLERARTAVEHGALAPDAARRRAPARRVCRSCPVAKRSPDAVRPRHDDVPADEDARRRRARSRVVDRRARAVEHDRFLRQPLERRAPAATRSVGVGARDRARGPVPLGRAGRRELRVRAGRRRRRRSRAHRRRRCRRADARRSPGRRRGLRDAAPSARAADRRAGAATSTVRAASRRKTRSRRASQPAACAAWSSTAGSASVVIRRV